MIKVHAFKRKKKEGNKEKPQFGGQWKVPSLVVNRETSLFSGHWKAPNLMALEMFHVPWPLEGK